MKRQIIFLISLFSLSIAAYGQSTKDVNVANTPNVTVVNTLTDPVVVKQASGTRVVQRAGPTTVTGVGTYYSPGNFTEVTDVTDVIVSIQQSAGNGCSIMFTGGVAPSQVWFDPGAGLDNGIKTFHFDPPIPSNPPNYFSLYTYAIDGSSSCLVYMTMLGVQQ